MADELLRLKRDIINKKNNEKYYIQDELRFVIENKSIPHKERVDKTILLLEKLGKIDNLIGIVESVFQSPQQQNDIKKEPIKTDDNDVEKPNNVVEVLNNQTHSE